MNDPRAVARIERLQDEESDDYGDEDEQLCYCGDIDDDNDCDDHYDDDGGSDVDDNSNDDDGCDNDDDDDYKDGKNSAITSDQEFICYELLLHKHMIKRMTVKHYIFYK